MAPIKNFYNAIPRDVEVGDVFVCVVTCHVVDHPLDGGKAFRVYRCPWPNPELSEDGIPQGDRMTNEGPVGVGLFPVLLYAHICMDSSY